MTAETLVRRLRRVRPPDAGRRPDHRIRRGQRRHGVAHTPGGLGIVEAGMMATYVALGVPTATALIGVLCYRLIGQWLPVLVALPVTLTRRRTPSPEARVAR